MHISFEEDKESIYSTHITQNKTLYTTNIHHHFCVLQVGFLYFITTICYTPIYPYVLNDEKYLQNTKQSLEYI